MYVSTTQMQESVHHCFHLNLSQEWRFPRNAIFIREAKSCGRRSAKNLSSHPWSAVLFQLSLTWWLTAWMNVFCWLTVLQQSRCPEITHDTFFSSRLFCDSWQWEVHLGQGRRSCSAQVGHQESQLREERAVGVRWRKAYDPKIDLIGTMKS